MVGPYVRIRAAERLKILIAINLRLKILIFS
jgi:hypothetical protein